MATWPPDLTTAKAHLNETDTGNDAEIQRLLDTAVAVVEGMTGPLGSAARTETAYPSPGTNQIVLSFTPVTSVESITDLMGTTVPIGAYPVGATFTPGGVVTMPWLNVRGPIVVHYTSGYPDGQAPATAITATLIILAHLWTTQRGTGLFNYGPTDQGVAAPVLSGFGVPRAAVELLEVSGLIRPAIA